MRKLRRVLVMVAGGTALLAGQDTSLIAPVIYPPPVMEPSRPLREYLNLTSTQVTALQEVQKSKQAAEQAIFEEMRQKHTSLENLLRSGSNDFQQIGRLTVELRDLQKKLPVGGEPYRTRALAVLSADQRAKLPALSSALQLQWPSNDAVWWNLIERPADPQDPRILPFPVPLMSEASAVTRQ